MSFPSQLCIKGRVKKPRKIRSVALPPKMIRIWSRVFIGYVILLSAQGVD